MEENKKTNIEISYDEETNIISRSIYGKFYILVYLISELIGDIAEKNKMTPETLAEMIYLYITNKKETEEK